MKTLRFKLTARCGGLAPALLCFFCLMWGGPLAAQAPEHKPCITIKDIPEAKLAFDHGEKITMMGSYAVGLFNADVGEVTFSLARRTDPVHGDYFQADGTMKTRPFFNTFFKVDDKYRSMFYAANLRPFYYMRDIHQGKYTIQNYYHYRPDYQIDTKIVRKSGAITDTLMPGRICTFDIVTLLYFVRCLDLGDMKPGDFFPISFAIDDDIYDIYVRFDGREVKKVKGLGSFKALKFSVQVVAGVVFTGKEELVMWVSDDRNRLPLSMESPVIVGRIAGRLSGYENLRYPLSSKVN